MSIIDDMLIVRSISKAINSGRIGDALGGGGEIMIHFQLWQSSLEVSIETQREIIK